MLVTMVAEDMENTESKKKIDTIKSTIAIKAMNPKGKKKND